MGFDGSWAGTDLGEGGRGCAPPPEMTCGFLIQLVFCQTMWFIGVEVEQEKSAPPPKKILDPPLMGSNPIWGSDCFCVLLWLILTSPFIFFIMNKLGCKK